MGAASLAAGEAAHASPGNVVISGGGAAAGAPIRVVSSAACRRVMTACRSALLLVGTASLHGTAPMPNLVEHLRMCGVH